MVKKNVVTWSYVRCSTTKQDLTTQSQQLIDYSNAYGFSIDNQISDLGISGSEFNRAGLSQIKEGMKNQSFNQLLIYSISRLGRSMVETITFLNELNDNGINAISLKENLDLSTPSGKMISSIFSSKYFLAKNSGYPSILNPSRCIPLTKKSFFISSLAIILFIKIFPRRVF